MNRIPPTPELIDAAKFLAAPAFVVALGVGLALGLLVWLVSKRFVFDWRRTTPAVSVLALFVAVAAVNHFRETPFPWQPDGKWWHFGGWAVAACFAVEFVARAIGHRSFGYLLRGLTAGVIAHFVVDARWQAEARWWVPAVGLWLAASWAVVAEVSRRQPGGASAFAGSFFAGAAGIVLLHAKSLGLSDLAIGLSIGLFALALIAWLSKTDAGGAATVAVVPVLTFLLLNRELAESDVPVWCHRLLAITPLLAGLSLLPPVSRHLSTRRGGIAVFALTAVSAVVAVILAVTLAPMTFDEEKW
jgi:hypothetical protein